MQTPAAVGWMASSAEADNKQGQDFGFKKKGKMIGMGFSAATYTVDIQTIHTNQENFKI